MSHPALSNLAVLPALPIAAESSLSSAAVGASITAASGLVLAFVNHRSTSRQVTRQYK